MSLVSFIGPRPNLLARRRDQAEPPMRLEVAAADPHAGEHGEAAARRALFRRRVPLDRARHLLSGRVGRATAWRPRSRASPRTPRTRSARASTSSSCPTAASRRHAADPGAARDRRGARAPGQAGTAHVDGPRRRDRLGARSASLRAARRLRRRGDPSVPRARDARASWRDRSPEIDPKDAQKRYIKAICKGLLQGDVQDGHLDVPVVLRRADLRGGRPAEGVRRQVLHRHGEQRSRASACSRSPTKRSALHELAFGDDPLLARQRSTRAASTSIASAAKSTCGRRTRSRSCSTRRARTASRRTRNMRR